MRLNHASHPWQPRRQAFGNRFKNGVCVPIAIPFPIPVLRSSPRLTGKQRRNNFRGMASRNGRKTAAPTLHIRLLRQHNAARMEKQHRAENLLLGRAHCHNIVHQRFVESGGGNSWLHGLNLATRPSVRRSRWSVGEHLGVRRNGNRYAVQSTQYRVLRTWWPAANGSMNRSVTVPPFTSRAILPPSSRAQAPGSAMRHGYCAPTGTVRRPTRRRRSARRRRAAGRLAGRPPGAGRTTRRRPAR